ncbi:MAG: hydrogenase maturation protease [Lentisphaerae bacterium]|nr:hydrogenase maturation protease [Lentisphaerota bacterium]
MTREGLILVVGMGNLLCEDDGVGIHLVRALAQSPPRGVALLDAGTALINVLDDLARAEAVLVLDAMQAGGVPGALYLAPADGVRSPREGASLHDLGLPGALHLLGADRTPRCMWVLGVEPARMGYGMDLSPPVRDGLPVALAAVRRIVSRWRRLGPGIPTLHGRPRRMPRLLEDVA